MASLHVSEARYLLSKVRQPPRRQGHIDLWQQQLCARGRVFGQYLRTDRWLKHPQMRDVSSPDAEVSQMSLDEKFQHELLTRLRRIEGQARGVQRMVEEGRDCTAITHQLNSIRAATQSASVFLLKYYARECWTKAANEQSSEVPLEDLIELMVKTTQ
jgi:DNA-binding FrmR family transcriptional regulator